MRDLAGKAVQFSGNLQSCMMRYDAMHFGRDDLSCHQANFPTLARNPFHHYKHAVRQYWQIPILVMPLTCCIHRPPKRGSSLAGKSLRPLFDRPASSSCRPEVPSSNTPLHDQSRGQPREVVHSGITYAGDLFPCNGGHSKLRGMPC